MAYKHWQLPELTSVFADNLTGSIDPLDPVREYEKLFSQTLPPKVNKGIKKLRIKRITLLSYLAVHICHDVNIDTLTDANAMLKLLRERFKTCSLSIHNYTLPIPNEIDFIIHQNDEAIALIDEINKTNLAISNIYQHPKFCYLSLEEAFDIFTREIYKKQYVDKDNRKVMLQKFKNEFHAYYDLERTPLWIKQTHLEAFIKNIQQQAKLQPLNLEHGQFWRIGKKHPDRYPSLTIHRETPNTKG